MIARLYDALHKDHAEGKHLLTCPTEWDGFTHRYFVAPRTAEDLVAAREAIADWARITYGWLGRSPDYKAAFLATLGANADFYDPYQENARRWYRFSQERVPFVNHAIVHPPVDRNMAPGAPGGPTDIYAHVTKETDAGIYVTGAKVVATGSGANALHLCRACRAAADPGQELRAGVPRPDQCHGCQVHLPRVE
jgi:aromatic ring hydroxylase